MTRSLAEVARELGKFPVIPKTAEVDLGFVYLIKSRRFYKIGRTNALGRRERELAIQLPEAKKANGSS